MPDRIAIWKRVVEDARLLERAADVDASDVSAVASLRRDYSAERVAVALELCRARDKAVHKFGERGRSMVADVQGIEQASSHNTACVKIDAMISAMDRGFIVDLCCGAGGDSMAMTEANDLRVLSVDRDPLRAWMTRYNTSNRGEVVCADVSDLKLDGVPIHIDPARRDPTTGRRAWRLSDYEPGPEIIERLIKRSCAAAVKLSPGVDSNALPWPGDLQFISEQGRLVQAVLWTGAFAGDLPRRATLIDKHGESHTLIGSPSEPFPLAPIEGYLYAIDPSVERAQVIANLVSVCGAHAIHPKLGLLTSDRVVDSPWLTGFEFIERMPWRAKRVKQWLAAHDGGLVEVKTRGKACDPDREQRNLRGDGGTTYTVFVLRFDTKVEALVTRRL